MKIKKIRDRMNLIFFQVKRPGRSSASISEFLSELSEGWPFWLISADKF